MTAADIANSSATGRSRALSALAKTDDSDVSHLLHDLANHLERSRSYVARATIVSHLERALTATELQSDPCQLRGTDLDEHVGDRGDTHTERIKALLERVGVAERGATKRGQPR